MAGSDPTNDTAASCFGLSQRDRKFLQELLTMVHDGASDELAECDDRRRAARLRQEQSAYGQLLAGLEGGRVDARPGLISVLRELAGIVDAGNEYRRVVAEHDALQNLIGSLEPPGRCGSRRNAARAAIRCRGDSSTPRR